MMSMKIGLASVLRGHRLVACDRTNLGRLQVLGLHDMRDRRLMPDIAD
jgi:hypothetical protein